MAVEKADGQLTSRIDGEEKDLGIIG